MRSAYQREQWLWWGVALIMFVYIIARALYVPLVHDEARMFRFYIDTGVVLPPNALLDAGNHLLVSLISNWSTLIFGKSLLAIRLFPVLTYPIYAYAIIALIRYIDARMIRVCFGLALLAMPFLFEYFSMFRGYGPAVAFEMMGCLWLMRFIERGDGRMLTYLVLFMVLAAFACLSLLPLCCIALAIAGARLLFRTEHVPQKVVLIIIGGGVPIAYLAYYGSLLKAKGSLYFGGGNGLVKDVAGSLSRWTLGINETWLFYVLSVIVVVAMVWAVFYFLWKKHNADRIPLLVLAALLALLCIGASAMHVVMDTPYPMERTALHFLPIAVLLVALAMDRFRVVATGIVWLSPIMLVLPLRTVVTANVDRTSVWADQAIQPEVFDLINTEQEKRNRPLVINTLKFLGEAWDLERRFRGDGPMSLDNTLHPQPFCDLMITDPGEVSDPKGFHVIHVSPTGRLNVWKRTAPLNEVIVQDTTFNVPFGDVEFVGLWNSPGTDGVPYQNYFVEVELHSPKDGPIIKGLITETRTNDGTEHYSDMVELSAMQPSWTGSTLHVVRRVPAWEGQLAGTKVFLYNPDRKQFALDKVHVRVYAIDP